LAKIARRLLLIALKIVFFTVYGINARRFFSARVGGNSLSGEKKVAGVGCTDNNPVTHA